MDLVKIMETFPTQEDCIAYLERLRWQGSPECPHCESPHVRRRNEAETGRIGRWNCHDCKSTFKVTHSILFHGEPKDTASEVVLSYRHHGKCEEKSLKLSTLTRFGVTSKSLLAYNDGNTRRNG